MGRPGRPAKLRNARFVGVFMEEEVLRRIDEKGVERSEFIRGAVEMALSADSLTEVLKEKERLQEEVKALRRECELKDRRIRELERELEHSRGLIAELGGKLVHHSEKVKELREKAKAKKYRTSMGYLTLDEIRKLYETKKDKIANPQDWLSAVLYDNPIAVREVAEALFQDSSSPSQTQTPTPPTPSTPSPTSSPAVVIVDAADAAEDAAEKERVERMLRAREAKRRRRIMKEMDFKALASEMGCSEEEAQKLVAEMTSSEKTQSELSEEEAREMIRRARSIIEGY